MKISQLNPLAVTLCLMVPWVVQAQEDDTVKFGGHVRVNFDFRDWEDPLLREQFEFESVKLTVNGTGENYSYKADYRWYENVDFNTIRYADLTYHFDDNLSLTGGITQVPFGLLPYASNSFWFSAQYYVGLEDDYDAGFVLNYQQDELDFHLGYFFNDEYNNASKFSRYSFDVADDGEYRNQEDGQINVRFNYNVDWIMNGLTELGASYQYGKLLNFDTMEHGNMNAWAIHARHTQGPLKLALQLWQHDYNLQAPQGQLTDRLVLSSFDFPFQVASEADGVFAMVQYTLPYRFRRLTPITCYSEYGVINGDGDAGRKSWQWVNGCNVGWDKFFIYLDSIHAENMWFSGGSGIGLDLGGLQERTHRININFGLYF